MNLELPPDARVHVFVLPAGMPPIPDAPIPSQPLSLSAPSLPGRPRHLLLKSGAVLALVVGAYLAGERSAPHASAAPPALARTGTDAPVARPPLPSPSAAIAPPQTADLPPAFRQQLQQPASVTPPPGAPPAPGGKNPFGLED